MHRQSLKVICFFIAEVGNIMITAPTDNTAQNKYKIEWIPKKNKYQKYLSANKLSTDYTLNYSILEHYFSFGTIFTQRSDISILGIT